jgi:hypothetical protein
MPLKQYRQQSSWISSSLPIIQSILTGESQDRQRITAVDLNLIWDVCCIVGKSLYVSPFNFDNFSTFGKDSLEPTQNFLVLLR